MLPLQNTENSSHKQGSHSRSPGKENSKTSRKRGRSVTGKDTKAPKRARMDVDELDNTCRTKQYIPHQLIGLMYRLDLSVLCSLRKSTYEHKYPSLSLAFEDTEIDKFNNIVLHYGEKSIHIQIENVDKYYTNNDINYAKLFTKGKQSFSINNYFDSFVKHLIPKLDNSLNNIEYLIIYTNSGLDLTEEKKLKKGRSRNFYPFKFDSINIEECDILKDFLFTNDDTKWGDFYQFSQDKTTREELLKRLEFSPAMQKVIKERKLSQEEIKEKFLDKLVFTVNQPNREELSSIIKNEIEKNSEVQDDYIALQEGILHGLTATEGHKKLGLETIYEFNLLMSFLHDMFLHKNMSSINSERKSHDTSNDITIHYKDEITYVKAHTTDSNIGYSQLFPSRQHAFSINKLFTLFVEELKEDIEYFIIYTNVDLDLTEEKKLKKGLSKNFYPLEFDSVDIRKKKYKILRDCSCINENGLYQFAQEETTREKLLSLLKLPPSLQKEKGRLSNESEREIKEKFLDKLIFAVNQPNREELNSVIRNEIDKSNVPYNYEELHEIALCWLESYELSYITKVIMKKLFEDIKNNRSSYQKIQNKDINEEIKFAKSVVGTEGTPAFNQFLDFLVKGEGRKYLEVLKRKGINLTNMSSILGRAGSNAPKAFKELYDLWFDKQGNRTQYLKTLEKEGMNLANISSILHGAGSNAPKAFKELYDLWFDKQENKTQYLKTLKDNGVGLARMSSILNGAGSNAPKAFKELYNTFFDEQGNKEQHLKHFIQRKDGEESFMMPNLSGILGGAGAKAKDAFENLHNVCFDDEGERTGLLDDFYNAGFRPSNLSSILCGAGIRASSILERLHSVCFDDEGERTELLDDFYNAGFRPGDLSSILSAAADSLENFHDFCFIGEAKGYLSHFLKEGFTPENLSKILHGAGANICSALKDFHDICFDEAGNRTQPLDDFYQASFRPSDLSGILSMAGNNATYILRNFHRLCFNKENYLNHFLAEKKLFTPKNLSRVLHRVGLSICPAFEKLHGFCFDKAGSKTDYLNNLIKNNSPNMILNTLYKKVEKVKKAPSAFLDEQNISEEDKITNPGLNPSSVSGRKEQEQNLGSLQQGDSKIKRKTRKGITNQSKNRQDDKILDTVADSSRDLFPRRRTGKNQIQSAHYNKRQREVFSHLSKFASSIEPVKQGLYLPLFEECGIKIDGKCVAITRGLSLALFLQSDKSFLSNLETSAEIYGRIAQGKQVSKGEEREVFAFSGLLDGFEQQLGLPTNSLPSNLIHTEEYKAPDDLSHYVAGIKGGFAIHLVTSNHVVAIYRTGDNYAYFDSNVAFVSGLRSIDQLMQVVKKGVESAGYEVGEKGFLVEHFDVEKANKLLSSEGKQILAKEIKTERQLLAELDKELDLIKINGQEVSRVQLYDFGTKINMEGGVPLLINAEMNLSSKKFQDHLDKKEVSMTAREYLDNLKNSKNVEEVVQATKVIPFIGSKREVEKAEQTREPKRSLLEQLVKEAINHILAAVSLVNISRSESQSPGTTDETNDRPESYLSGVTVNNQLKRSR